jgi:hypothetical protein
MKKIKLFIAATFFSIALILGGCVKPTDTGTWADTESAIVIKNNGGGNIQTFISKRAELAKSGKIVRIEGYCASACTIFYSLPNACMAKGSSLHFHGADSPISAGEGIANKRLARFYRAGIKEGFNTEWYKLSKPMHKLTRAQVKELDPEIKFCEKL